MKILLVTRGSQGDVYPYLVLATELKKRGHAVTLSLPQIFEEHAKKFELNYLLQDTDDINGMIDQAAETKQKALHVLKWMRRVIDMQFKQLIPLIDQFDLLIAANTEFSATSIAEYCGIPVIRTAFGPFIPGRKIPPPVFPLPEPNKFLKPATIWKILNRCTNFMVKGTVNKNRVALGMKPIKNFGIHAVSHPANFLMYSRYLGNTDPDWVYKWDIGGYCFNDILHYEESAYTDLMSFINQDERPTLFFTFGSCNDKNRNKFCDWLLEICTEQNYKLVVGSGWSQTGTHLDKNNSFYLLTTAIPHSLIFPKCTAVIHHGGCGTTHSVGRAGIPQMVVPLILDQNYWGYRVSELKIGPERVKINKINKKELSKRVIDLMTNQEYKVNAVALGEKMQTETGPETFCDYIEKFVAD